MEDYPTKHASDLDDAPERLPFAELVFRLDRLWGPLPRHVVNFGLAAADSRIGRYSIVRPLGSGAFGIVYLAYDEQLDRHVALKVPRPEVLLDAASLQRFEQEAQTLAKLDHPAIVPIFAAELREAPPYISLAYVDGPDLGSWLAGVQERGQQVPWQDAVALVAQLAEAVEYAHQRGIFHRDLKPSNILLLQRDGAEFNGAALTDFQPKLTDFGLAKFSLGRMQDTRSSVLIGTPLYMAPEAFGGNGGGTSADVYSLGCLLFEILAGKPPFEGDNHIEVIDRLRESPPPALGKTRSDLPRGLEQICRKCLEKNPLARYPTAGELAEDLHQLASQQRIAPRRTSLTTRFRYWVVQPQRARDAGWFALCLNAAALIWLGIQIVAVARFGIMTDDEYRAAAWDGIMALTTTHLPMVFFGWMTVRRHLWAAWGGLVSSLGLIALMFGFLFGYISPFEPVYRNLPYHVFAFAVQMIATYALQLFLFACAIAALSRKARRS